MENAVGAALLLHKLPGPVDQGKKGELNKALGDALTTFTQAQRSQIALEIAQKEKTGQPATTGEAIPDASAIFGGFDALFSQYQQDPVKLREIIKGTIGALALAASALSFIPFTSNVGGALASVLIHDLLEPFRRRAYDGSIDLVLRPILPTEDMNARLLVTGVEAGVLTDGELTDELARSGVRDASIQLAQKIATVKRFDVTTKDDIALARQYERDIYTSTVNVLQDQEKDIITDLRAQRSAAVTELTKIRGSRLSALQAAAG